MENGISDRKQRFLVEGACDLKSDFGPMVSDHSRLKIKPSRNIFLLTSIDPLNIVSVLSGSWHESRPTFVWGFREVF